jgi:hypothetical protein
MPTVFNKVRTLSRGNWLEVGANDRLTKKKVFGLNDVLLCRNLKYAAGLSPLVAGKANFADIYVSCCERFLKVRGRQMTYETSVLFGTHACFPPLHPVQG